MIQAGRQIVNLDAGAVSVDDQPVHLSGKEYGILELLSRHKGTTVTKEMFLNHLYGGMNEPGKKSSMSLSVGYARNSHMRQAAITISRPYGAAGTCFATRRQRKPTPNRPGAGQNLFRCHTLPSSPSRFLRAW
jgi:Transcriptional regulatory protein, C terminal